MWGGGGACMRACVCVCTFCLLRIILKIASLQIWGHQGLHYRGRGGGYATSNWYCDNFAISTYVQLLTAPYTLTGPSFPSESIQTLFSMRPEGCCLGTRLGLCTLPTRAVGSGAFRVALAAPLFPQAFKIWTLNLEYFQLYCFFYSFISVWTVLLWACLIDTTILSMHVDALSCF